MPFGLFPTRLAKPRFEDLAQRLEDRPERLGVDLDEIDVLRISGRRQDMELVEGGAPRNASDDRNVGCA